MTNPRFDRVPHLPIPPPPQGCPLVAAPHPPAPASGFFPALLASKPLQGLFPLPSSQALQMQRIAPPPPKCMPLPTTTNLASSGGLVLCQDGTSSPKLVTTGSPAPRTEPVIQQVLIKC